MCISLFIIHFESSNTLFSGVCPLSINQFFSGIYPYHSISSTAREVHAIIAKCGWLHCGTQKYYDRLLQHVDKHA